MITLTDNYIQRISNLSDRYCNLLLSLMEYFGVYNLRGISNEQAKEFYDKMRLKEKEN